ncbi:MAG: hypothetical protein GY841_05550, partial [FCB group bacterium]|nr:hypothetical protein [FCB group bacterium]
YSGATCLYFHQANEVESFDIFVNGQFVVNVPASTSNPCTSFVYDLPLVEGENNITVEYEDKAMNRETSDTLVLYRDTHGPEITLLYPQQTSPIDVIIENNETLILEFDDDLYGVGVDTGNKSSISMFLDWLGGYPPTTYWYNISDQNINPSSIEYRNGPQSNPQLSGMFINFTPGANYFEVTAMDRLGNPTTEQFTFKYEKNRPQDPLIYLKYNAQQAGIEVPYNSSIGGITDDYSIFEMQFGVNVKISSINLYNSTDNVVPYSIISTSNILGINYGQIIRFMILQNGLQDSYYELNYTVMSEYDQTDYSYTWKFRVDRQAPNAPIIYSSTHPVESKPYVNRNPVFIIMNSTYENDIKGYQYIVRDGEDIVTEPLPGDLTYVDIDTPFQSVIVSDLLQDGNHTIMARGIDNGGNAGPYSSYVVTIDNIAPFAPTLYNPNSGLTSLNVNNQLNIVGYTEPGSNLTFILFDQTNAILELLPRATESILSSSVLTSYLSLSSYDTNNVGTTKLLVINTTAIPSSGYVKFSSDSTFLYSLNSSSSPTCNVVYCIITLNEPLQNQLDSQTNITIYDTTIITEVPGVFEYNLTNSTGVEDKRLRLRVMATDVAGNNATTEIDNLIIDNTAPVNNSHSPLSYTADSRTNVWIELQELPNINSGIDKDSIRVYYSTGVTPSYEPALGTISFTEIDTSTIVNFQLDSSLSYDRNSLNWIRFSNIKDYAGNDLGYNVTFSFNVTDAVTAAPTRSILYNDTTSFVYGECNNETSPTACYSQYPALKINFSFNSGTQINITSYSLIGESEIIGAPAPIVNAQSTEYQFDISEMYPPLVGTEYEFVITAQKRLGGSNWGPAIQYRTKLIIDYTAPTISISPNLNTLFSHWYNLTIGGDFVEDNMRYIEVYNRSIGGTENLVRNITTFGTSQYQSLFSLSNNAGDGNYNISVRAYDWSGRVSSLPDPNATFILDSTLIKIELGTGQLLTEMNGFNYTSASSILLNETTSSYSGATCLYFHQANEVESFDIFVNGQFVVNVPASTSNPCTSFVYDLPLVEGENNITVEYEDKAMNRETSDTLVLYRDTHGP